MNNIHKSVAISLLLAATSMPSYAEDKPKAMKQSMDMGMSEEMKDKQAREKQQYILKIDDLSDRIGDEKDAKKKQALMDEQLQLIRSHQDKHREMKKKMMKKHHQKMMGRKQNMKM